LGLEKQIGLVTRGPRTGAIRQELEAWSSLQGPLPVLRAKPGRIQHEVSDHGV